MKNRYNSADDKSRRPLTRLVWQTLRRHPLISAGLLLAVSASVLLSVVPPLILERIVNGLTGDASADSPVLLAVLYTASLLASAAADASREIFLTVLGQKIIRALRQGMCRKLSRLPAGWYAESDPGAVTSRFVSDADAVETLFTSGVVGMTADVMKVLAILAVIAARSRGLGYLMIPATVGLLLLTRFFRRRMYRAQLKNRAAVGSLNGFVPETLRNIRMIRNLRVGTYMKKKYDTRIGQSYAAIEKTNLYDAVYSPIIHTISAAIIAAVMVLAVAGSGTRSLFGMSVGTAVAVIAYITKVFEPLESIGMEIQGIQSALAGVSRIREFLCLPERAVPEDTVSSDGDDAAISVSHVSFAYGDGVPVLKDCSFTVARGERVTLTGRTGAGKSTLLRLILGLYTPDSGRVTVAGTDAGQIPDAGKRRKIGYVSQTFYPVPGTVFDQIAVYDGTVTAADAEAAARLAGIHHSIVALPDGYGTPYADNLFSQGQKQLLGIARAACCDPGILLLDEVTANLDAATEATVLAALRRASASRTVLSVSHRLYEATGGRMISLS